MKANVFVVIDRDSGRVTIHSDCPEDIHVFEFEITKGRDPEVTHGEFLAAPMDGQVLALMEHYYPRVEFL